MAKRMEFDFNTFVQYPINVLGSITYFLHYLGYCITYQKPIVARTHHQKRKTMTSYVVVIDFVATKKIDDE
jgi:hypothetical protein